MLTQAEITRAYLEGKDIAAMYRRRYWATMALLIIGLAPPVLLLLYLIKSMLGIDLYADGHAWEILLQQS